ncbi:cupin domain-containing protein [Salipiger sp. HF18]|uniref:cupin domain-containing protein n=1 Tax=Salipiger sp. HF18 TaxID=2721557 RepID=UPI00142D7F49|nr:cupin domain-containing protein [Salipiger sp. HF18]NIY97126.1 cupin domain-containing protein [Salipiger sp. HF18]
MTEVTERPVGTRYFAASATVPNNPLLPVVILRGAFAPAPSDEVIARMAANGWGGAWAWTVFDYHHYHPDAHEALAVASGEARLQLGGPEGAELAVTAGDCLVLPAGTGHCRLSQSRDFRICGAYPPGRELFITRQANAQASADAPVIAQVPLPQTDPIHGADGPLVRIWGRALSPG